MSTWRPPTILDVLHDVVLRSNGNVHRLQLVRFGSSPHSVVLAEVREIMPPENIREARRAPDFFVEGPDGREWGAGLTKGLRADHVEWMLENPDRVRAAFRQARAATTLEDVSAFQGHVPPAREADP